MAATRVLPLRASGGRVVGTVRIEFLADKTRLMLSSPAEPKVYAAETKAYAAQSEPCTANAEPYAAYLARQSPVAPELALFERYEGGYAASFSAAGDILAFIACAYDGRILFEANRALSANNMEAFRRACRAAHAKLRPAAPEKPVPAAKSAPAPLPAPQSEALNDILATAKQLFPSTQSPPEPPSAPAASENTRYSPARGVRQQRKRRKPAAPEKPVSEAPPRPNLSTPFPKEDVFAASFTVPHSLSSPYSPLESARHFGFDDSPALRGEKIRSPFPNTYPSHAFYRVPLPFFKAPRDYCLIGRDAHGDTVYALPVDEDKKRLPPLCTGAALRRGTDGVIYATLRL